ncbi:MAG: hypothetical protein IID38_00960 [Planctomycetes bacterium]|nr:hypothetical protein [Planctomycetota bacterium]
MSGNEERARGIAAKAKNRTTLFDLLERRQAEKRATGSAATGRLSDFQPDLAAPKGQSTTLRADRKPSGRFDAPKVEPEHFVESGSSEPATPERVIELDNDRVRISLTSVGCAVVVFALAVLAVGAFDLGRRRGDGQGFGRGYEAGRASYAADTVSEIETARNQPPATHLVASLLERPDQDRQDVQDDQRPAQDSNMNRSAGAWIRDYTYIVAQEFGSAHLDDAPGAQDFLAEHGIESALVQTPRGTAQLITVQGFDRSDPTQRKMADQLLQKVHAVGAQYYADGGGYKLEGYFKTLKGDRW